MKKSDFSSHVLFRTHFFGRAFSDALFRTLTMAPSVGLFSKLTMKPTKPSESTENK
jgi:hypothetical protein